MQLVLSQRPPTPLLQDRVSVSGPSPCTQCMAQHRSALARSALPLRLHKQTRRIRTHTSHRHSNCRRSQSSVQENWRGYAFGFARCACLLWCPLWYLVARSYAFSSFRVLGPFCFDLAVVRNADIIGDCYLRRVTYYAGVSNFDMLAYFLLMRGQGVGENDFCRARCAQDSCEHLGARAVCMKRHTSCDMATLVCFAVFT